MTELTLLEKIVALCKRRGFVFPSSEIYGGINGVWDYGPLGAELKNNIKMSWWKAMTQLRTDVVGLDGSILMNREVWKASGHEEQFADWFVDCKLCHARFRLDHLKENACPLHPSKHPGECGGELTEPRRFNLLFKTYVGPLEEESTLTYLRPETAQSIFVQFKNVLESSRMKIPFGIAQIGKAFRNEVNPRNFIFRSREFEQMELEYFIPPDTGFQYIEEWKEQRILWYESIGIPRAHIHVRDVPEEERAFYSKKTYDLEYDFPFGRQELEGIAYRTDFDLKQHGTFSGKSLEYYDEERKCKYIPHVVEPSAGVDRTLLALLCEAYREEEILGEKGEKEKRVVLGFSPRIAPIKVGIFPLLKNKIDIVSKAKEVFRLLQKHFKSFYDESGAIGRRYRRMDEIGTPFCVTIDFETLEGVREGVLAGEKNTVTVRYRDSMRQERVRIEELVDFLREKIE
ncbi:glycine--tRNA ligase [Methylacidiphilum sp. Yel]|jgi:glycyl-tRNA synthetase|uniref:glycine--tRNA ligase n=1 Tax=Methylacidiphilum sp. Yel TaxID=1847730 RepID=UPI00106C4AFA|nr:glycine--tRNA ligase [Methylacidiphilum sp. Yel]TFE66696.1 glycine--tRNA ligase [Methylacidiphilum sp. Yel]